MFGTFYLLCVNAKDTKTLNELFQNQRVGGIWNESIWWHMSTLTPSADVHFTWVPMRFVDTFN